MGIRLELVRNKGSPSQLRPQRQGWGSRLELQAS